MRDQLEQIIQEMLDKGILYDEARREFEKLFITRALQRANSSGRRTSARSARRRCTGIHVPAWGAHLKGPLEVPPGAGSDLQDCGRVVGEDPQLLKPVDG